MLLACTPLRFPYSRLLFPAPAIGTRPRPLGVPSIVASRKYLSLCRSCHFPWDRLYFSHLLFLPRIPCYLSLLDYFLFSTLSILALINLRGLEVQEIHPHGYRLLFPLCGLPTSQSLIRSFSCPFQRIQHVGIIVILS